ncbi:hypothetical protein P280DRAFT_516132 [Massarina eburnea CBS 473.64]|uniref:Calcium-dependent phosphotriesterase n=1 Tax=Massarina eburnea CBS 473.64 TaxID=1395130 RepID=A0A6A6S3D9_9PLEO|nr:hypothetical protein P280DRAFT_516132 [Massarina eburnea CBS 473.64]
MGGNLIITQYQLYPENADFDFNTCKLYTSNLFNASLGVYDSNARKMETIIEFPNVTNAPDFHLAGVQLNPRTNLISLVAGSGVPFSTNGKTLSGTDLYLQYDPQAQKVVRSANLSALSQSRIGGYQDVDHDPDNNAYIVSTFPASIIKVNTARNTSELWYQSDNIEARTPGFAGIATKDWTLIANDRATGGLFNFDMRAAQGVPVPIRTTPNHTSHEADGMQLPPKYDGRVLLVAEQGVGASVFRDLKGEWKEAEFMGVVPYNDTASNVTKVLQMGNSIYMNIEVFTDNGVMGPGLAGNRSEFMYVDVTEKVEALLKR